MTIWYLVIAVLLLLANGVFVAAEFAFVAVRRSKLDQLASKGNRPARRAQGLAAHLSLVLAACQLGITMASLGLGVVAEPAIAHLLEGVLHDLHVPDALLHPIAFVVALMIVVFFHMVIGEMAPKNIAIARPDGTALGLSLPMHWFLLVFRPLLWLLNTIANGFLRLFGVEPTDELTHTHTRQEIRVMVNESARGGLLKRFEQRLLSGAIDLGGRDAASVMVPRTEMTAASLDCTPGALEQIVLESGHSRIPVYSDDLDHIVGFFHAKDLLRISPQLRDRPMPRRLIRQMLIVPETRKLQPLLLDMRRQRKQIALVIDEHGGTAGVVTLEDLLEELVGEIADEHDLPEVDVERLENGGVIVPGGYRVADLGERLGVEIPEGDYETVAGFIMERLGRIPKRLDTVEHENWRLRVQVMYKRRVMRVLIEPLEGA